MLKYIETQDESLCCGCRACEQVCPVKAITIRNNQAGFLYPALREDVCIECKLCETVCPAMNKPKTNKPINVYAVQHKNSEILKESSSGGVFRLLADKIIKSGGCVVGCKWDENYQPVLSIADTIAELLPMQGSKYLSSNTLDVYTQVEKRLKKGQTVLFTGAPCQCAGMINYLRKNYDNLITADFLCHGMPSQQIFDHYLDEIEKHLLINSRDKKNYGIVSGTLKRKITSYKFRDKEKKGWGIVSSYTWIHDGKECKHYRVGMTDDYICGFLKGYFNRYSCYSCSFRGEDRFTDFTFCDYWGVQKYHQELVSSNGVSAVTVNTSRGVAYVDQIQDEAIWIQTETNKVAKENPTLVHGEPERIPEIRSKMYKMLNNQKWNSVARKYFRDTNYWANRIWYAMPNSITKYIKKFFRG